MRSIRRSLTPLALILGLLFAQRVALAAAPAPAATAKVRSPAQLTADKARSEKMKAKWADPAQAALMVKARHGGNSPAAKSYRMKAQWADPALAAKLTAGRHGGNSKSARSYRAKAQWADPAKRQVLLDGQAKGRAARAAGSAPAPVVEEAPAADDFETSSAITPATFAPPNPPTVQPAPVAARRPFFAPPAPPITVSRGSRFFRVVSKAGFGVRPEVRNLVEQAKRMVGSGDKIGADNILPTEMANLTRSERKAINDVRATAQR